MFGAKVLPTAAEHVNVRGRVSAEQRGGLDPCWFKLTIFLFSRQAIMVCRISFLVA
jgi:hypothetical protein